VTGGTGRRETPGRMYRIGGGVSCLRAALGLAGALASAALVCIAYVWHTSPREEHMRMTDGQKEAWVDVLLAGLLLVLVLGNLLVGGLLVLRLTGN
jgi:hypothetical protein